MCMKRPPVPCGPWHRSHSRANTPAPRPGSPARGPLVEHGPRPVAPSVKECEDRFGIAAAERAAVSARPRRHRRPGSSIEDRAAQELVGHRREEVLVPERRRLVGRVAAPSTPWQTTRTCARRAARPAVRAPWARGRRTRASRSRCTRSPRAGTEGAIESAWVAAEARHDSAPPVSLGAVATLVPPRIFPPQAAVAAQRAQRHDAIHAYIDSPQRLPEAPPRLASPVRLPPRSGMKPHAYETDRCLDTGHAGC